MNLLAEGVRRGLLRLGCWLGAAVLGGALAAQAPDRLDWRAAENRVDAQIQGWPLQKVLETIAATTRWQIYVEPAAQRVVSAKFRDAKPGDALRRLLGDLNFVLLPSEGGPSRLYIFRSSQAGATQLIAAPPALAEGSTNAVRNELIVTLKPDGQESIDDLAKRLGARVVGRLDSLHTYRLQFDSDSAAASARQTLAAHSEVSSIQDNLNLVRQPVPEALQSNGSLPLSLKPRAVGDGSQVVIGLIDTPVQTAGTVLKDFLLPGISVAGQADTPAGELSHGTAMAETILYALAKAPDAAQGTPVRILPVDVYGSSGSTTTFQLAQGVVEAINAGASIVNLSLGGLSDSTLLRGVIEAGRQQGVVFLAAAGNEPVTTPTYPAAYPGVIAVTAIGRNGEIASYANRGDFVSAAAPGTSVVPYEGQSFVVVGTSAATAHASAFAGAVMATTSKRGSDLESQIRQTLGLKSPPGKN